MSLKDKVGPGLINKVLVIDFKNDDNLEGVLVGRLLAYNYVSSNIGETMALYFEGVKDRHMLYEDDDFTVRVHNEHAL